MLLFCAYWRFSPVWLGFLFLAKMRLNAILGRFELWGEIWYWHFANKQIFSGLEIYHFPTAGGMHAYAFLSEKQKKNTL